MEHCNAITRVVIGGTLQYYNDGFISDKRRSQVQVRRIVKRGLFSAIGRIVRGFTCAVVDDLLSLTSCDGGEHTHCCQS